MARRKKSLVEHNALVQAIELGKSFDQIKDKFEIKNSTQLKLAYVNALIALGRIVALPTASRGKTKKPVDRSVTVNSRGNLILPKALVQELEIDSEALFDVEKTPDGISIQPAEEKPKVLLRKKPL